MCCVSPLRSQKSVHARPNAAATFTKLECEYTLSDHAYLVVQARVQRPRENKSVQHLLFFVVLTCLSCWHLSDLLWRKKEKREKKYYRMRNKTCYRIRILCFHVPVPFQFPSLTGYLPARAHIYVYMSFTKQTGRTWGHNVDRSLPGMPISECADKLYMCKRMWMWQIEWHSSYISVISA